MSRKYYAVVEGRIDKPTIYSSWAQVHPRVLECENVHKEFTSHLEAVSWMKDKGAPENEIEPAAPRSQDGDMLERPVKGIYYYAVAHGRTTGVFGDWRTTEAAVTGFPSACYQKCDTEHEAKRFIKEWKDAYADTWRQAIRRGLDEGWKPEDLKVDVGKVLDRVEGKRLKDEGGESICLQFEDLELDEKRKDSGVKSRSLV